MRFSFGRYRILRCVMMIAALIALSACAQLPRKNVVEGPTTAPPQPVPPPPADGSLFRASYTKPLFEDRRPRGVGDILTVILDEKVSASKSSSAKASRNGSVQLTLDQIPEVLQDALAGQGTDLSGANSFNGSGGANASNNFVGTITVTVMDVMPNGNLQVAGEKRIGINQGVEYILFSGVVNPRMITAESTVTSTQVANARLEYYGDGYIDEAQHMGWFQRLLLNVTPF